MTSRRIVAVLVLLASWVPALASIVIAWVFELPERPLQGVFLSASPPDLQSRFDEIGVTVALIYGALAAVLIVRRPHPVAIVLAVHSVGSGLAALGVQWGLLGFEQPDLPAWGLLAHAAGWAYVPGTVATTIIPVLILRPRPGRVARAVIGGVSALAAIAFLAALVHQMPGTSAGPVPVNPLAIDSEPLQLVLPWLYGVAVSVAVALSIGVAGWVIREWSRAPAGRSARTGWLAVGHAFLTISYLVLVLPASDSIPPLVWTFGMVAPVIGQLLYPSATLVLVLGHRLRGVESIVARVLLSTILVVAAVTAYLVVGAALTVVPALDPIGIGIISAAMIALAVQPARRRIAAAIDRLVYGPDGDPAGLLRRLGERVGVVESGAEGVERLADALRTVLDAGAVEIVSDELGTVGAAGEVSDDVLRQDLRAGGARIGEIRISPRAGERVPGAVVRDVAGLAGVVATAVRLAVANARLTSARTALVAARQVERRALRRELHDSIGPALAGVGFGLAAVDNLRQRDTAAARGLAERLADDLRAQLAEVRRVARSVRSVERVLVLDAELHELAADFAGSGTGVVVDARAAWRVPSSAIRPLFLIAGEAVHNAVRHAGARSVRIDVTEAGTDRIMLTVSDDGCGFDQRAATTGVGLASMREHALESGALFSLESGSGGTVVSVLLPLSNLDPAKEPV